MVAQSPSLPSGERARLTAAWISLVASVLLLALKTAGYFVTGSSAVLSDALESIVNVLAAGVALAVMRFASQPADREHPYGHGKAEYVSASFEGGLIVFAAVMIFIESALSLSKGPELKQLDLGFVLLLLAAGLNAILSLYLKRVGIKHHSEALQASAAHVMSDVVTTVGVGGGLLVVRFTGWAWLDPIIAMLVAVNLAWEGSQIVRKSFAGLVDEINEKSLNKLAKVLERYKVPGIIEIHQLRAIRAGRFHHIDAHVVVPEYWDVHRAHDLTQIYERQVVNDYPYDAEIAFHMDPCRRKYCRLCDVGDCPVRQAPFEELPPFTVTHLIGDSYVD